MYSAHSAHVGSFTTLMTYGRPKCLLASAPSGEERRPQCSIRAAQPARRPLRRACEGLSGRSRCNPVEATLRVPAHRELRLTLPAPGDLAILVEGDKRLFNQYGVMLVNPAKHPHIKAAEGQAFGLACLAGRSESHRRVQSRRRATILSERLGVSSVLETEISN